ncbi:superinfection immunity protein [Hymenobacter cavernae]|uniref:superinfection immunity protein n=1 Tax=Hymenobacter cavernae TaxID=2044852 RepID=UPI00166E8631
MLLLADVNPGIGPLGITLLLGGYLLPTIYGHHQQNHRLILLINVFLGWTIIGWLYALHLALRASYTDRKALLAFKRRLNNPLT